MCDLATGLLIGGLVLSGGGQVMSGIQANQAAKYNAQVAAVNAENERRAGRINEGLTRDELRREMARQRAALGRAGVNLGVGSALDLGQDAGEQAFIETQAVRTGSEARARSFDADARLSRAEGRASLMSGAFRGAGVMVDNVTAFHRAGGFARPPKKAA